MTQSLRDVGRLVLAIVAAGAIMTPELRAQDVAQGAKIAKRYCSRCHAVGATGVSPHASAPPFRTIAGKGRVDDLQEALAEGIRVGHPDMPEFALPPEQIAGLLAYLKSLAPGAR